MVKSETEIMAIFESDLLRIGLNIQVNSKIRNIVRGIVNEYDVDHECLKEQLSEFKGMHDRSRILMERIEKERDKFSGMLDRSIARCDRFIKERDEALARVAKLEKIRENLHLEISDFLK